MITDDATLYRLMAWNSPAFPTGGFSYSHGLEFAIEQGLVNDADALGEWLRAVVAHGSGWSDSVLFAAAWQAASRGGLENDELAEIVELAAVLRGSSELALESSQQGEAFAVTVAECWKDEGLAAWQAGLKARGVVLVSPLASAMACWIAGMPCKVALLGWLQGFVANLVSAGVRLVPLGQAGGQRVLKSLETTVIETRDRALASTLDDLGSASPVVDWASACHETQYTRLFRS
ncbi:MAG: urease accessory protein UreF [Proteobacteria bacterium]|nr:urease accessory protein UreF [Pseudomonadota bacterium]